MAKVMKTELIDRVAERAGVTKQATREVIDALLEEMTDLLIDGCTVTITGFGTLAPVWRTGRSYRSPADGREIEAPGRTVARFRAGEVLNKRLNGR